MAGDGGEAAWAVEEGWIWRPVWRCRICRRVVVVPRDAPPGGGEAAVTRHRLRWHHGILVPGQWTLWRVWRDPRGPGPHYPHREEGTR